MGNEEQNPFEGTVVYVLKNFINPRRRSLDLTSISSIGGITSGCIDPVNYFLSYVVNRLVENEVGIRIGIPGTGKVIVDDIFLTSF